MLFADRPPEELGEFTGFLMNYLGRRSGAQFGALLEPYGLQPRDFGVMVVIAKRPGKTQQELAELSRVDPSSMVALLDELEARGLAERRPHPGDRRKRCIYLTSKGSSTMRDLQVEARRSADAFFARLSAEERATLHRLLRKLAALD